MGGGSRGGGGNDSQKGTKNADDVTMFSGFKQIEQSFFTVKVNFEGLADNTLPASIRFSMYMGGWWTEA